MKNNKLTKIKLLWAVIVILLIVVISLRVIGLFTQVPDMIGVTNGRLADCPDSPNCVCSQADPSDPHYIEPLQPRGDLPAEPMDLMARIIENLPGTRILQRSDDYLHAEFRSLIFGFVDDVEFMIDRAENLIHIRSASRIGWSDLGANRRRIEKIRALWAQQ